jgi:hypothetical protein
MLKTIVFHLFFHDKKPQKKAAFADSLCFNVLSRLTGGGRLFAELNRSQIRRPNNAFHAGKSARKTETRQPQSCMLKSLVFQ